MRNASWRVAVWLALWALAIAGASRAGFAGAGPLPGMPPVLDPANIYLADAVGNLSPAVRNFPTRLYVPNSESNTVDVIDPATYKVVDHFAVGRAAAARHALLRPQEALGAQRQGQQPHAHRSHDREEERDHPGHRSLQHVLHARRQIRHRGGRAARAPQLPGRRRP